MTTDPELLIRRDQMRPRLGISVPAKRKIGPTLWALLQNGFAGPRPGDNCAPLMYIGVRGEDAAWGEELMTWMRKGWLRADPAGQVIQTLPAHKVSRYGEIPEVYLTHIWRLTAKGYEALKP